MLKEITQDAKNVGRGLVKFVLIALAVILVIYTAIHLAAWAGYI